MNSTIRSSETFPLGREHTDAKKVVRLFDLVILDDRRIGRVMYIGPIKLQRGEFVGLHLLNCTGKHNGTHKKRAYFDVPEKTGTFVKSSAVEDILPKSLDIQLIKDSKDDFEYYYSLFQQCYSQSKIIKTYPRIICSLIIHNLAYYLPDSNFDILDFIFGFVGDYEDYRKQEFDISIKFGISTFYKSLDKTQNMKVIFELNKHGERKGIVHITVVSKGGRSHMFHSRNNNKRVVHRETHSFRAISMKELTNDRILRSRRTEFRKMLRNENIDVFDENTCVGYIIERICNNSRNRYHFYGTYGVGEFQYALEHQLSQIGIFKHGFVSDKIFDYIL